MYKVFQPTTKHHLEQPMFFGETPDVARYDKQKYPIFEKLINKQLSFFWRPEEIDLTKDRKDFQQLTENEKHIFLSNLKYQTLLDSIQGRAPNVAFLPIVSLPELETLIETWSFFETIHSRSYTHLIRNIVPDPAIIFDSITEIDEIIQRAKSVTKTYDDLIEYSMYYNLLGLGIHKVNDDKIKITLRELKRKAYLTFIDVNILEGIRFYVSFACSWAFCELKSMEGNAKMIELIARDENLHLAMSQNILKYMKEEGDTEMTEIIEESQPVVLQMFKDAVDEEKAWGHYLFKDDSMIGLNEALLSSYVEYIANKRMKNLGFKNEYKQPHNPLPWTKHYLNGGNKQVAPMETEITSYVVGGIQQDVDEDTFDGFSL